MLTHNESSCLKKYLSQANEKRNFILMVLIALDQNQMSDSRIQQKEINGLFIEINKE